MAHTGAAPACTSNRRTYFLPAASPGGTLAEQGLPGDELLSRANKKGVKMRNRSTMAYVLVAVAAMLAMAVLAGPAFAVTKPKIKKVTFTGPASNPTITVTGTGLGSLPAEDAEPAPACFGEENIGDDFGKTTWFGDETEGWTAGESGDCIGLIYSEYTETEVVFHFGSAYREYTPITKKDTYTLQLYNLTKKGKISIKKPAAT